MGKKIQNQQALKKDENHQRKRAQVGQDWTSDYPLSASIEALQRATSAPSPALRPGDILTLQRCVGNRAVQRKFIWRTLGPSSAQKVTVQQTGAGRAHAAPSAPAVALASDRQAEAEADRVAGDVALGRQAGTVAVSQPGFVLQRDNGGIRSPVFEETVTQISDVLTSIGGRSLTLAEQALAQGVFGNSIDYSAVRLLHTGLLEYRTVGNTIRVPENFTIRDAEMAETLIHEMTHIWQYQHYGTGYVSYSLADQIEAYVRTGSLSPAYAYEITADTSFFDLRVEQQAFLVQNYYAMLQDRSAARDEERWFRSNHLDPSGAFIELSWDDRQAEIAAELPLHGPLVGEMRRALPPSETGGLESRVRDLIQIQTPGRPEESEGVMVRPLVEWRF